jgi:hypothetical protein
MLTELPKREYVRRLIELPNWMMSNTDTVDPTRAHDNKDMDDPNLVKLRKAKDEPR